MANSKNIFLKNIVWFMFVLSLCFFSLGASWKVSSLFNFSYKFLYHELNIDETIEKYAPQNNFNKEAFKDTDEEVHYLMFSKIVQSINNNGVGLSDIVFQTNEGISQKLLTSSEILHLQDVSHLIGTLTTFWFLSILLCIVTCIYLNKYCYTAPTLKLKLTVLFILSGLTFIIFFVFGFTEVFYYLHTVVFPEGNQWFFYYQDSLMSTLMKAPDLFGAIALLLIFNAGIIYLCLDRMIRFLKFIPAKKLSQC